MIERSEFSKRIRQLRLIDKDWTLREVAERAGIDFSYLSKVESGTLPPPKPEVIIKLADVLGADKDDLLELAGKVSPDITEMIEEKPKVRVLLRVLRNKDDQELERIIQVATRAT